MCLSAVDSGPHWGSVLDPTGDFCSQTSCAHPTYNPCCVLLAAAAETRREQCQPIPPRSYSSNEQNIDYASCVTHYDIKMYNSLLFYKRKMNVLGAFVGLHLVGLYHVTGIRYSATEVFGFSTTALVAVADSAMGGTGRPPPIDQNLGLVLAARSGASFHLNP